VTVIETTPLDGVLVVRPRLFADARGSFRETWREAAYGAAGITAHFVQDNLSVSHAGVLRGLHAQRAPHAQGKLVSVPHGRAYDVAVDIRPHSPTYGHWFALELDGVSGVQLYIPPGCLHGFLALEDHTVVQYKCTVEYHAQAEYAVRWDDPTLGIAWPAPPRVFSDKDAAAPLLADVMRDAV
jgi:dTDP-4-dehydrorhamnose 3,5-epimerase